MKIGILTFHRAHNYGAVLQAYGLQEYLKGQGHEVFVIDYNPDYFKYYKPSIFNISICKRPLNFLWEICKNIFLYRRKKRRYVRFQNFIEKRLNLSSYDSHVNFDYIVLGSDQIWNRNITGGVFDPVYWGTTAKCKIISYAASMVPCPLKEEEISFISSSLNKMRFIGVRESLIKSFLSQYTARNIQTVMDPTLLVGTECFSSIAECSGIKESYVLSYDLTSDIPSYQVAEFIAKKCGLKHIHVSGFVYFELKGIPNVYSSVSPEKFLGFLKKATFVVTSSFHGTVFSFLFKRQFYTIRQHTQADMRYSELLEILGLMSRFIEKTDNPDLTPIDYSDNKEYVDFRKKSALFINKSFAD